MKIILIITCILAVSVGYAYSESEIPSYIKEESKQLNLKNNITEKTVMRILADFSKHNIIKNTQAVQQIYTIPDYGQTGFVKLSGRIAEFGRTAHINLEITRPDGVSEKLTSPLLETGRWSTSYPVNSMSQAGTYRVTAEFAGETKSVTFFHLTKSHLPQTSIPPWFLVTFEWWTQDQISDWELVNAVQYLVDLGLVIISDEPSSVLQVKITGEELVRRGTTHTINVHVSDGINPIPGAKVTLVIEDYGEDIIREFDGFTNQNGYFVYSWEIPKSFDDIETLLAYISVSGNGSSQTQLFKFRVYCMPGEDNCKVEGN